MAQSIQEFDLKDKQTAQSKYVHASLLQDKNLNLNSYWSPHATLTVIDNKVQKKKWFTGNIFYIININIQQNIENNYPNSQIPILILLGWT